MIKLVLQPIVENAVEHGIDMKKEGAGRIHVSGQIVGDRIAFIVSDNGPGMAKELIDNILVKHSVGYGLSNVNDRIKLFFGNEYGIRITSDAREGTQVKLEIPKYKNREDERL
jgi:two-component system sensor histidine kinase YesM